ncbi:hypothetical protein [Lutibacter maritimus]|uniref:Uncharacterized protein n=1 Tax=Lutibacter maritimus TaxID=593133 RepID=A0A1I6QHN8_9FLAO|nr:hypothetical protein [Lutibacter maritimus]SFS51820.1 hypothetical protein SAMN04488006_1777 [Lutibacter maritimus]
MKKIILSIVFVFASLAMVNANSSIEDKVVKVRDCVDQAMGNVETVAMVNEEDIRGEYQDYYLELYMEFYLDCMAN